MTKTLPAQLNRARGDGWLRAAALCLALPVAHAAWAHDWRVQGPQSQEVVDAATGLIWRRCVEGMYWTGDACAGDAQSMDWTQAQARARAMAHADAQAWKLPTLAQLKSLAAFARSQPAAFAPLFPQSPSGWYWSGSSSVNSAAVNPFDYGNVQRGVDGTNVNRISYRQAWAVEFGARDAQENMPRRSALHVRLVRAK